jgi:hypothetical protein
MSVYKINHYLDKMNKMLVTTKTMIMAVMLLMMAIAIANPVIALAVNQSAFPQIMTQTQTIKVRKVLKCFPITLKDIMSVLEE